MSDQTAAARNRAKAARDADVGAELQNALASVNWKRRNKCGKSLRDFAATYCVGAGGFLEEPPPPSMRGILDEMQTAIGDSSAPYHIRIARGHGKTSYMKCAVAFVLSYGIRRYVVSVAANAKKASAIIKDIGSFMCTSPKWCQDFPEVSVPLRRLGGAAQRARTQTCNSENTNSRVSATDIQLPTVRNAKTNELYPTSGAVLTAVGLTGNARGLVVGSMRPDLVLFDDLQDETLAKNEERVLEAAQTVRKSFMGLAGHRKKIAAIMTSTPIAPRDLSELFAADKAWKTTTYRMVLSFPRCFGAKDGDLWQEYADIYQSEKLAGRKPHVAANRFYRAHRAEMDAGAEVLNPHNFDRRTEISAIQHALNLYFRDGEAAFMSEYQMEPPRNAFVFELTAETILHRIRSGVPACTIPDGTVLTVAATDLNPGYAITTAVTAFDVMRTGFVTAYAVSPVKIPDNLNDTEFGSRLFNALCEHGRRIASWGIRIDLWGIDAGGRQFDTVTRFVKAQAGLVCGRQTPMLGRAGQNWNPFVRSRIRAALNDTVRCRDAQRRSWLAFNADVYKEAAQKAWGAEAGAAGGLSLFDGGLNHSKFAVQVANETLISKTPKPGLDGQHVYKWRTREPHDYGDCLAMCYALAGSEALTGDGTHGAGHHNRRKVYNG